MYIAFKWLFGLSLAMWLTMCFIDVLVKRNIGYKQEAPVDKETEITNNTTTPVRRKVNYPRERYSVHMGDTQYSSVAYLHCFMFLAGALVVSLYNRKNEIILYTKLKISNINKDVIVKLIQENSKRTAAKIRAAIMKYVMFMWVKILTAVINIIATKIRKKPQPSTINIVLLKKLHEIGEERKNLSRLLMAAIHENKNIRMKYQLENMEKNKLVRHIEKTHELIKENRSRYSSFQQLYLVTHQENTYLKGRVRKLAQEKEEAENNLLELMNQVYKSKNNELKSFCSRFIVRTKNNLLNSDIGAEIQKFLDKSKSCKSRSRSSLSSSQFLESSRACAMSAENLSSCAEERLSEIVQNDAIVPLVSDAPKLKGLPGECVWTVKDKDGLIERLYEYDYETDLDGDTVRRIRQYSVYYDKDCLLDFSPSRTIMHDTTGGSCGSNSSFTSQGFLTGSEAFQRFMQNNRNVISTPSLPITSG